MTLLFPHKTIAVLAFLFSLVGITSSSADERVDHFEGKPATTLEVALANMAESNTALAEILNKSELTAQDLGAIHELTYTLENALERIRKGADEVAESLETLHLASEHGDESTVRDHGTAYLENAQRLVPPNNKPTDKKRPGF